MVLAVQADLRNVWMESLCGYFELEGTFHGKTIFELWFNSGCINCLLLSFYRFSVATPLHVKVLRLSDRHMSRQNLDIDRQFTFFDNSAFSTIL